MRPILRGWGTKLRRRAGSIGSTVIFRSRTEDLQSPIWRHSLTLDAGLPLMGASRVSSGLALSGFNRQADKLIHSAECDAPSSLILSLISFIKSALPLMREWVVAWTRCSCASQMFPRLNSIVASSAAAVARPMALLVFSLSLRHRSACSAARSSSSSSTSNLPRSP